MKKLGLLLIIAAVAVAGGAALSPEFRASLLQLAGTAKTSTTVYKWQDQDGNWHVTNQRPAEGIPYQEQEYLHDVNLIPSVRIPDSD